MSRWWLIAALPAVVILADLALLVSGQRVLVKERHVTILDRIFGPADIQAPAGTRPGEVLQCHYFTGRGVVVTEFAYARDNVGGRDSCPFIYGSAKP